MIDFDVEKMSEEELVEAANGIFSAQEADFAKIKSEKWYQTLFHAITLNQDGKKYAVRGISSLAKLQQLFMGIYIKNYRKTHEQLDVVIETVTQNSAAIKKLYGMCVLNLEEQVSLESLDSQDAEILAIFLGEYRDENGSVPSSVQAYNRGVLGALNQKVPSGSLDNHQIRRLKAPRVVYRCFMEQCAVDGTIDTQEWTDKIYEDLKDFELSENSKNEIKEAVKNEAEIAGTEYFTVKYSKNNVGVSDMDFEIDIEASMGQNYEEQIKKGTSQEEKSTNDRSQDKEGIWNGAVSEVVIGDETKMVEYCPQSMIEISRDRSIRIINRIIRVSSFVRLSGRLQLEKCVIIYNADSARGELDISDSGILSVTNSLIVCRGYNDTSLIKADGSAINITIDRCTFNDCSNLFNLVTFNKFEMTRCHMINIGDGFLNASRNKENYLSIESSYFELNGLEDFNKKNSYLTSIKLHDSLGVSSDSRAFTICHCLFKQTADIIDLNGSDFGYRFIRAHHNTQINNCTVKGVHGRFFSAFENASFFDDVFIDSKLLIELEASYSNKETTVDNCLFDHCSEVIVLNDSTTVSNCQFLSCNDHIITGKWKGGSQVKYCEFVNIMHKENDRFYDPSRDHKACLTFSRSKEKDSSVNYVEHCIFNGADIGDWLLIDITGYEKPRGNVLQIIDCDFRNCRTKRKTLLGEYIDYYGLFNSRNLVKGVYKSNCTGIENTNGSGHVDLNQIKVKVTGTDGERIGMRHTEEEMESFCGTNVAMLVQVNE